ncbi:hypothetical protein Emag_003349 [Eimeria magna]
MALVALWRGASSSEELLEGRPQRFWIQLTDNFEMDFVPKLPSKPNGKHRMHDVIRVAQQQRFRDVGRGLRHKGSRHPGTRLFATHDAFLAEEGRKTLPNPYEQEIRDLPISPPPTELVAPPQPRSPQSASVTLVSSLADLQALIDAINIQSCTTIGIEVKSSADSYRGFTGALLISSDDEDYVVDPFRIYSHLHRLNAITANPNIQKVFFDAPDQILFLQAVGEKFYGGVLSGDALPAIHCALSVESTRELFFEVLFA